MKSEAITLKTESSNDGAGLVLTASALPPVMTMGRSMSSARAAPQVKVRRNRNDRVANIFFIVFSFSLFTNG